MERTWILVADEGRARFLETRKPGQDLEQVDELTDAAAHADNADLRRDAQGRRAAPQGAGSSVTSSAGEDKLDQEAELFARRVADHLSQAVRQQRYERLRIVAAPKFLGRLRKQLPREVKATVVEELDKDLVQLDKHTLTQRLCSPDTSAKLR